MRFRLRRSLVIGATASLALALTAPTPAFAKDQSQRTQIESAPAWTAQSHRVGTIPGAQQLEMSATLGLRDAAGAEALATSVSDPSSVQYGQYVTAAAWRSPVVRRRTLPDSVSLLPSTRVLCRWRGSSPGPPATRWWAPRRRDTKTAPGRSPTAARRCAPTRGGGFSPAPSTGSPGCA